MEGNYVYLDVGIKRLETVGIEETLESFVEMVVLGNTEQDIKSLGLELLRNISVVRKTRKENIEIGSGIFVSKSNYDEILLCLKRSLKIEAIKKIRTILGLGLKEAKDTIDNLIRKLVIDGVLFKEHFPYMYQ